MSEPLTRYYLFGQPVTASLSPAMHNAAFRALRLPARYEAVEVGPDRFIRAARERLAADDFGGANVTIPHKRAAMGLCDVLSPDASAAGAVNTFVREPPLIHESAARRGQPRVIGHNTDVTAARSLLRPHLSTRPGTALLIGAGGAAAGVVVALAGMGLGRLVVLNRSEGAAAELAEMSRRLGLAAEAGELDRPTLARFLADPALTVAINATPLKDEEEWRPLGLREAWGSARTPVVLDLAYRDRPTFFTVAAARAGCRTIDGREMLLAQGIAAFERWTGVEAPVEVMRAAVQPAR
ncbi:MAG: shikimate dehydrogenase family protein [Bacillota bacterium]